MSVTPLIGEPLALDLVNTRARTPDGEVDLLDTVDGLRTWLAAQGDRLTARDAGAVDRAAVRELRGHVADAVEHARTGAAPPAAALRAVTEAQRAAPGYRRLGWDGTAVTVAPARDGNATAALLAELAEAAADLLAGPSITKVRHCEGPECRMIFLPAHPRRRWCSPALCGNRVRVARYYQRHKD